MAAEVHYHNHKRQPPSSILSHINLVPSSPPHFLKIHFNPYPANVKYKVSS